MSSNELPIAEDEQLLCHEDVQYEKEPKETWSIRARLACPLSLHALRRIASGTSHLLAALLPSYLRSYPPDTRECSEAASARKSTNYLDGLRGVAALTVFNFHFAHGTYAQTMDQVYGSPPMERNNHILQLPVIRLFYAAEASVAIFFILSGYTLCRRSIAAISSGNFEQANVGLSSLALRRGIRLFAPAIIASLLVYLAQRAGWMPAKGLPKDYVRGFSSDSKMYLAYLGTLLEIWTWKIDLDAGEWWFNPHLWTVPVEFRCSMVGFLLVTATQRCRAGVRLAANTMLVVQSLWVWRWDVMAFAAGTLIAELEYQPPKVLGCSGEAGLPPNLVNFQWKQRLSVRLWYRMVLRLVMFSMFVLGLYLASYPYISPREGIFFSRLAGIVDYEIEGRRLFHVTAGTLILLAIVHEPLLQSPLRAPFLRYLGRISYAFYLVHGLLIRVVGGRILHWSWTITGTEGIQFHTGFLLSYVLLIPVVVWAADLFERAIDSPCIVCSKWIENQCSYSC